MPQDQLADIVANCDQEPIHALGFIQPHGALLCFDRVGCLIAKSANAEIWLGALPELGETISDRHLSPLSRQTLRAALEHPEMADESVECRGIDGHRFDLVMHWSDGLLFAEFEQLALKTPAPTQFALFAQRAIQRLQNSEFDSIPALLQAAADSIRAMTGFDRVMGYRFLPDASGEVIAEAKQDALPPYIGQRYPASDIPAQARRLYVLNPIRQIASVDAVPVPIVPPLNSQTHGPYDLSHSVLRSVSPIHIEYLKNMGVGASMSVSIVIDGKLWGLFACHHMTPLRASHAVRLSCTVLTQVVSILIARIESKQRALAEQRVHDLRARIASELAHADDPLAGIVSRRPEIAELMPNEAVSAIVDREVVTLGGASAPDREALIALADHMAAARLDVLSSASVSTDLPQLGALHTPTGTAAGFLAIQITGDARITIVWLREELVETINWAGPPDKVIAKGVNGPRLTPRGSFEIWKQTVRGRCREWTDIDQFAARELKSILQDVALNRMREVERARTTLLATLGHDLRNPLQAINMAVQLMGRGLANTNDTARRVEGSTRRMQSLINYILDVSRIRSGVGLGMTRQDVPLRELLDAVVEQARLTHPGMRIVTDFAPDLGVASVDPDRFNQALTNLIANARQHGDMSYPVELIACVQPGNAGDGHDGAAPRAQQVEVRNRLLKRPTVSFERLTDPFKSGSLDNPNNQGGLGLGLYIANAIIKGHDAKLDGRFTDTEARLVITLPPPTAS
ncbi:histidine kinase dimerization/phospho-acceptor domain-containing protein [Paraburkholderia phosphatilytica]|uniref:histidine kinase dimerization/phospho-acceptor domain-containing protein n=1 Tax=Paraburkholderia phosphatilytica TaxID=2282883 RepID=UPI0013E04288|nr:histidine kinase dimerization/phospho-acceptor domain-containing protein [Paraburkholderia phosphatilytica]